MSARRIDRSQVRITRGAMILLVLEVGLSLVWLLADRPTRALMLDWLAASPDTVWGHGRVWTLATSALLETNFVGLLLHGLMLFLLIPTLERFWGTARFLRFAAITSLLGTLAGTALGLAIGSETGILGLTPFIYGAVVAFGIIYARSPVQIFGVLPLTGRQMMYGFIGFQVLSVVLQAQWAHGAALAAAMGGAALMTSKSWNPGLAWKRWRIARARAHLSMVPPPRPPGPPPGRGRGKNDEKWLN